MPGSALAAAGGGVAPEGLFGEALELGITLPAGSVGGGADSESAGLAGAAEGRGRTAFAFTG
jgi:hypothetical protein